MLGYFVLFLIIGFFVAKVVSSERKTFFIFIVIAIGWAIGFGVVWGLVSFGELCAGYAINKITSSDTSHD
jgi:hypothetical protein